MSVVLAATYDPRGEIPRLQRFYPWLQAVYTGIVISLPPYAHDNDVREIEALPGAQVIVNDGWEYGRYMALKAGVETGADDVHYNDLDRLLRWVETRPDEWRRTVEAVQQSDCLIIGRTAAAYATHPAAMIETEAISNKVVSHLLGKPMDVSAGSKGFSLAAAQCLLALINPGNALGTDAEWPILLRRCDYEVDYLEVDGLDWETADRYRDDAADPATQRRLAEEYDRDPEHWAQRVKVAQEITSVGLSAMNRVLDRGDHA
jgi:hypothetical protein